jgi:hypothetical protein
MWKRWLNDIGSYAGALFFEPLAWKSAEAPPWQTHDTLRNGTLGKEQGG